MASIIIPTPLRKFTDNTATVTVEGATVLEAMKGLATTHPGIEQHIFDGAGNIRSFVRVYVGDEDIKSLDNQETAVAADTIISIIPAIAGGAF